MGNSMQRHFSLVLALLLPGGLMAADSTKLDLSAFYSPPAQFQDDVGQYKPPFSLNRELIISTRQQWQRQSQRISNEWHRLMGPWPELLSSPKIEFLDKTNRENFVQHRVRVETAPNQTIAGYLLVPNVKKAMPAVIIPFYEPETSIGMGKPLLDFGYQLAKRGFVTLSIGSPGGDAWKPSKAQCQPLSFLAYIAANCHTALAHLKEVDPKRIGILGHSYGGKWAMFGSCLYDKFACAVWCDPGIVFDETRPNVNYWEPWYLGLDPTVKRKPGVPTNDNPRTGSYKEMIEKGHDLHELHALMAPRPFLVSGGSEDPPERWRALNSTIRLNEMLGYTNRVAMTNRKTHTPTAESNEQIYRFLQAHLGGSQKIQPD
jgi:dienelactone hydrolase